MNESIYALIPPAPAVEKRPPRYHSQHSVEAPPSYTTFPSPAAKGGRDCTAATLFRRRGANLGREVAHEINPKQFLRAGGGHHKPLPPPAPFHFSDAEQRREPVPSRHDKPVMGLKTEKNFVAANAVEAICAAPRHRRAPEEPRPTLRPTFGKTPKYLDRVKGDVEAERQWVSSMHEARERQQAEAKAQYLHQMPEEEKSTLLSALRERWDAKHKHYQSLPFARDTAMQIARREALEKEMKEIEDAMAKLNRKVVYVYKDTPGIAEFARAQAMKEAQATALQLNDIERAGL